MLLVVVAICADAAFLPYTPTDKTQAQEANITVTGLSAFPGMQFAIIQQVNEIVSEDDYVDYDSYYLVTFTKGDSVSFQVWNSTISSLAQPATPLITCDPSLYGRPGLTVKKRKLNIEFPYMDNATNHYTKFLDVGYLAIGFKRTDFHYRVTPSGETGPEAALYKLELVRSVYQHPEFTITCTGTTEEIALSTWGMENNYLNYMSSEDIPSFLEMVRQQPGVTVEMTPTGNGSSSDKGSPGQGNPPKKYYSLPFGGAVSARTFGILLSVLTAVAVLILFVVVIARRK